MKLVKVFVLVLMLSSFAMPAMAADPIKAMEGTITGGLKGLFVDAADSIFNYGMNTTNETEAVKDKYGYSIGAVHKIASYKHDPYESKTVQEMRKRTAIIGVFLFIIYVFYGAACVNLSCGGAGWIERAQYVISETPFSEYKNTLLKTFGAILFTHYLFKFIILFNEAVTNQVMYDVSNSIRIVEDQWTMYFMMAFCYGGELIFYAMRILLMDLLAGSDILIGALFAFSFTRGFSIESIKYFGRITLLQFIIVLITAFGIAIIGESNSWLVMPEYLALMLVLFVISGLIMFGFSSMFKAGKIAARSVKL
jgi:hypothetical protein